MSKITVSYKEEQGDFVRETEECSYIFDGEAAVITYLEPKGENIVPTKVKILWTGEMLSVIRSGEMLAEFRFFKDKRDYEVKYKTPVGTLAFDTKTKFLDFKATADSCYGEVIYTISQNGDSPIERTMIFEVK